MWLIVIDVAVVVAEGGSGSGSGSNPHCSGGCGSTRQGMGY